MSGKVFVGIEEKLELKILQEKREMSLHMPVVLGQGRKELPANSLQGMSMSSSTSIGTTALSKAHCFVLFKQHEHDEPQTGQWKKKTDSRGTGW